MPHSRSFRVPFSALIAGAALVLTSAAAAAEDSQKSVDDSTLNPTSQRFSEDAPRPGAQTVRHWSGQSVNPVDGRTYTYDIVGADPSTGRAATIGVDIIPLNLTVGGVAFNGSDRVGAILASPLFKRGDYASTNGATNFTAGKFGKGSGGALSAGNTNVQLLDATMRSQFDKVGTGYHLYLRPEVRRPVSIDVPAVDGSTLASPRAIVYGIVDALWFQPLVESLMPELHLNPTRLALFVTSDILLYGDHMPAHCCVFGAHGAIPSTSSEDGEDAHGDGRPSVQTFVWASWMTAGFFNPITSWTKQDINGLSHEITEWANNPFGTTTVAPSLSPAAPQYGCNNLLETGDPTVNIGFSAGVNTFDQNAYSDGTYHPQDEAFLPWFMRTAPNHVSQPTQSDPTAGRYTFMGDLNPIAFFHQPPPAC